MLIGTGKAIEGDGLALDSGLAPAEGPAEGVTVGSGAGVEEHPASSTTIAKTMARRKFTGPV